MADNMHLYRIPIKLVAQAPRVNFPSYLFFRFFVVDAAQSVAVVRGRSRRRTILRFRLVSFHTSWRFLGRVYNVLISDISLFLSLALSLSLSSPSLSHTTNKIEIRGSNSAVLVVNLVLSDSLVEFHNISVGILHNTSCRDTNCDQLWSQLSFHIASRESPLTHRPSYRSWTLWSWRSDPRADPINLIILFTTSRALPYNVEVKSRIRIFFVPFFHFCLID